MNRIQPRSAPSCEEVAVVVPAFNEEAGIARQLEELLAVMRRTGWKFETIVVDDGSTDATASIAAQYGVRILRQERNRGYGAALKAGIESAASPWILITDADGTYPSESIPSLLSRATIADMVVAARTGASVRIPWERRPAKWLLGLFAAYVTGRRIPDLNSGMRLMRRSAVLSFWDLLPNGFSFTTTITMALLTTGGVVAYVPIDYRARVGRSKIVAVDFLRFLRIVARMGLRYRPLRLIVPLAIVIAALAALTPIPGGPWAAPVSVAAAACMLALVLERKARAERLAR